MANRLQYILLFIGQGIKKYTVISWCYLEELSTHYTFKKESSVRHDSGLWLFVEYPDIYNYFITSKSKLTKDNLKAYKSLDVYKYVVDGCVGNIMLYCP